MNDYEDEQVRELRHGSATHNVKAVDCPICKMGMHGSSPLVAYMMGARVGAHYSNKHHAEGKGAVVPANVQELLKTLLCTSHFQQYLKEWGAFMNKHGNLCEEYKSGAH